MTSDLFPRHSPACVEQVQWPGDLSLEVSTYLIRAIEPGWTFSSARAIVLRGSNEVLVVTDPTSIHILPGGRLEVGESPQDAVHREIAEETGCTIDTPQPIGVLHYRWLKPPTDGRPYSNFLQAVFAAVVDQVDEALREKDGHELSAEFRPLAEGELLFLTQRERILLDAAMAALKLQH